MKLYQKMALFCLFLAGCSHSSHETSYTKTGIPADYQQKLDQEFAQDYRAEYKSNREPSAADVQLQLLKAQIGDLNNLKPGKFEVYVFPKLSQRNHKEIPADAGVILGKPLIHEVSILVVTDCEMMIKRSAFSKYSPKNYFPQALGETQQKCAIVEVSSRTMRELNRSLVRNGDEMSKRLYLDDKYNVYGLETDFYERDEKQKKMNLKTVGMKFENGSPSTSAFGLIPVDMPSLSHVLSIERVSAKTIYRNDSTESDFSFKSDGALLDKMAIRQISRLNRQFKAPQCALHKLTYKDYYRNNVEMYWCEGLPWPQAIENNQFVAITQNLSVR